MSAPKRQDCWERALIRFGWSELETLDQSGLDVSRCVVDVEIG